MRATSGHIADIWTAGGPFIGTEGKPHSRVTVEVGWTLQKYLSAVGTFKKPPLRYFQRADNAQVETEVPGIKTINIERSIDQDADTCTIVMMNQKHNAVGVPNINSEEFGNPGWYSFSRGASAAGLSYWGHTPNAWYNVLVPNALIRTYQGFGGTEKTIAQALADGNIVQTGIWLVDEVRIGTTGDLQLRMRDMTKLLIDQILYPPLIPEFDTNGCDIYPLNYCRYYYLHGTQSVRINYGAYVNSGRYIRGIEYAPSTSPCAPGEGYWLAGDDGGVFTYGYINYQGSMAGLPLNKPIVGIARTDTNNGYWLVGSDGGVYSFGDADFYGSVPSLGITITNAVGIERTATGKGYYIFSASGGIYSFGDAVFYGSGTGSVVGNVVGMAVRPGGYWIVTHRGYVYSYGSATYYGGQNDAFTDFTGMAPSYTGNGYYLLRANGAIYTYGDAPYFGSPAQDGITLNDPATDMAVHPSGIGYWIAAEDGGVFTYGNGMRFYGSLPGPWVNLAKIDGNYFDYADIVKDMLRWSGFWLYDGGVNPQVYGNIETTGITNNTDNGCLPDDLFDKKAPIDVINQLKSVVGYVFWVDEEGAAHFESPNWWSPGNFLMTGAHTSYIPELNEGVHVSDYAVSYNDRAMRSQIIISSAQPDAGFNDTVTTVHTPAQVASLRGIERPLMWVNELFINPVEQQVMAELIDMHINFQRRIGAVTAVANPLIQVNDQVRIVERQTAETYIHYVRGISTSHNLDTGEYTMQLTTNWLGDTGAWSIYVPSVVVRPTRTATQHAMSAPSMRMTELGVTVVAPVTVPTPIIKQGTTVAPAVVATAVAASNAAFSMQNTATPSVIAVPTAVPNATALQLYGTVGLNTPVVTVTTVPAPTVIGNVSITIVATFVTTATAMSAPTVTTASVSSPSASIYGYGYGGRAYGSSGYGT